MTCHTKHITNISTITRARTKDTKTRTPCILQEFHETHISTLQMTVITFPPWFKRLGHNIKNVIQQRPFWQGRSKNKSHPGWPPVSWTSQTRDARAAALQSTGRSVSLAFTVANTLCSLAPENRLSWPKSKLQANGSAHPNPRQNCRLNFFLFFF